MDPPPTITQRFIEHTVMWALALPVQIRHDLIGGVRPNPRNFRQAFPARELSGKEPIIGKFEDSP